MVPIARGLDCICAGNDRVVEGAAVVGTDFRFGMGIVELNLEPSLNRVIRIGANEDTAIAVLGELEFEIEYEVAVGIVRPNSAALYGSGKGTVLWIGFPYRGNFGRQVAPPIEAFAVEEKVEAFRRLVLGGAR